MQILNTRTNQSNIYKFKTESLDDVINFFQAVAPEMVDNYLSKTKTDSNNNTIVEFETTLTLEQIKRVLSDFDILIDKDTIINTLEQKNIWVLLETLESFNKQGNGIDDACTLY